jgi:energy-coupling factor transporter ATP-binding protein EcfA2
VESAITLPSFTGKALAELIYRHSEIRDDLRRALASIPDARDGDDFTTDYRRAVYQKLDRMELFGVDADEAIRRYPLSVAYVSIGMVERNNLSPSRASSKFAGGMRPEDAFAGKKRVLLTGEAGSGKTTLLRWLAVSASRRDFGDQLSAWNGMVPFYVPLARYGDATLPPPERFLDTVSTVIAAEMPGQWVHRHLRAASAIVLIDGIDELQEGQPREEFYSWLADLIGAFPDATYVVTSRPAAADLSKLGRGFSHLDMLPMTPDDVNTFVENWHDAISRKLVDPDQIERLPGDKTSFLATIDGNRHLRALTVNPLLCAVLCALNRRYGRELPKERMQVYGAAIEMLIGRRDRERHVPGVGEVADKHQRIILQDLAFWLLRQSLKEVPIARAQEVVARTVRTLDGDAPEASKCLAYLLVRSGLVRQPVRGRIDFIHRTFQEYLAAKAAVDNDEVGLLLQMAQDDQWRDVIVMAVGHARTSQQEELLRGLIAQARSAEGRVGDRLALLAVACLQTSSQLAPSIRQEVENLARRHVPPASVEAAESLAAVGDLALEALSTRLPRTSKEILPTIRLLSALGGDDALSIIEKLAIRSSTPEVGQANADSELMNLDDELLRAWRSFDREEFADRVMSVASISTRLTISEAAVLPFLDRLSRVIALRLDVPDIVNLKSLSAKPRRLTSLRVTRRPRARIDGIERWAGLEEIEIDSVHMPVDLAPLRAIPSLRAVRVAVSRGISVRFDLSPLRALPNLRTLILECDSEKPIVDFAQLSDASMLTIHVPQSAKVLNEKSLGRGCQVVVQRR